MLWHVQPVRSTLKHLPYWNKLGQEMRNELAKKKRNPHRFGGDYFYGIVAVKKVALPKMYRMFSLAGTRIVSP